LNSIEKLDVAGCQLTAGGIENISDAIRKRTIPVNLSNLL